jgi:RsiW-degrading membrane proteinase PrsW (M82 family)
MIIGLAAAVYLIMIFIESQKTQSQSKDSLVRWFCILIMCLIALELLNTFIFK